MVKGFADNISGQEMQRASHRGGSPETSPNREAESDCEESGDGGQLGNAISLQLAWMASLMYRLV